MSLGGALNAAVSGLNAQSQAIATVSENIANVSTTAYKINQITFESLVTGDNLAGGVIFETGRHMTQQGLIENTGVSTNIALNGNGFFVVTASDNSLPSEYKYSRNGDFATDENGFLINNEGMILLGYETDATGALITSNVDDLNSLTEIDLYAISSTAESTSEVTISMNLPADAAITDSFPTTMEIFDELGVSHTIEVDWTKTAVNEWTVTYSDPYQTSLGSASPATATIAPASQVVTFNGDGSIFQIDGVDAATFAMTFTGFTTTTGSNDTSVTVDMGAIDTFTGLTQFSSDSGTAEITINSVEQDGVRFGQLTGIDINDEGLIIAVFDNGIRQPIFQIPVATFAHPDGLVNVGGSVFDENDGAGNLNLRLPGQGSAGTIVPSSLELSTVDTSEEFNKMIVAQQAYSSAAQVVSTVDDMFDTLLTAVR